MSLQKILKCGCMFLLVFAPFATNHAFAQNANTGEIRGTVQDSTGALLAGVAVTITNVDTGVSVVSSTNSAGIYDAPSVPIGPYTITFVKTGFKEFVRKGVTLELQTVAIDATLQVGDVKDQITVTAEAPLLQTETSDQGINLDARAVQEAPIVGTTWFGELTKVLPGASGGGSGNRAGSGGDGIATNGTQAFSANYQIEGTGVTDVRDGNVSNNYPPVDAIGEVSVSTANAGAQSGNAVSLNVNLKSGTNRWHGSLFESVQNDLFNSRNYFQTTGKKAVERWNNFGGSIGGPISKDKLFFFFTYQRNPVQSSGFYTTTVPTAAMRNGDFSDPSFHATIYDKSSCSPAPCARTPLNGGSNMLLSTQIDPVAAAILSYFPQPTDPNATTNNYSAVVSTPSKGQWYVGKVDYQISPKHRLSGAIVEYPTNLTFNPDALCGLGFDCTTSTPNNRNQSARITETWSINDAIVNEFRMGAFREHDQYATATWDKNYPTKIGMEPTYGIQAPANVFPNITVSSSSLAIAAQTFIGGGVHANLVEDGYNASDVLTLVRGRHTIKMGGELDRWFQHDTIWGDASSGDFTFTGVGTNSGTSPDARNGGATSSGIPFADFLLGDVGTWNIYNGEPTNIASWITSAFVNDDFKVTPHLTLNVGLRYQHQTGWAVANGRFANFNPTLPNPGAFLPPGAVGAMQYGEINGHNTIEPSVNSWSPRIGVAWSPMEKWSFRASYGVFQAPRGTELYAHDNFPGTLGFGFNPQGFIGDGTNVAFQLQNGPPPGSLVIPTAATLTPQEFNYQRVGYYPSQLPLQYFQEFLLSAQHELPGKQLLDVSFVHTKGTHLNFATDMNQVPASQLANPFNTGDYSPYRPVPWFRSILSHDFSGWSNYDALQLRLAKRLGRGVYYQFNYSWSKMLDTGTGDGHDQNIDIWQVAQNPRANYGLSAIDAPHIFSGALTYELPFGEGRQYPVHGALNQVAGGWWISSVIQARSGIPFTPTVSGNANGGDLAKTGSPNCFCGYSLLPNRIGTGKLSNPSLSKWFDVSAFTDPTNNGTTPAFGNSGRDILRGPRFVEVDLSLGKTFRVREGMALEIRADATNAFNHPLFNLPDANILDSTAGQITSGQGANGFGPGRIIQMGGRFTF